MSRPRLALVPGEPAGVGPELCVRAAQCAWDADLVVFGEGGSLQRAAAALDLPLTLAPADAASVPGALALVEIPAPVITNFGLPVPDNAGSVIAALHAAAAA
jgi:4-hydroxythreonine-4-phosphate dehydrogenase